MGVKCRRIDREKAQEKAHQGQTADAVRAGCFLKCSESGYILDWLSSRVPGGRLKGQRVADKRNDQESCVGEKPVMAWFTRLALGDIEGVADRRSH